jgi:hypothetical protein|nr:hypothetical protein [Lelliottia steviae]
MTTRTPPSIAWLAKKYISARSELVELESDIAKLLVKRDALRADVASLERVIDIHEVPIHASELQLTRENLIQKKLKYGSLSSAILKHLRSISSGSDASISEIFYAVIESLGIEFTSEAEYLRLRNSVSHQLRNMCNKSKVVRTIKGNRKFTSRYRLIAAGDQLRWDFS